LDSFEQRELLGVKTQTSADIATVQRVVKELNLTK
jgi:hypothetical protein